MLVSKAAGAVSLCFSVSSKEVWAVSVLEFYSHWWTCSLSICIIPFEPSWTSVPSLQFLLQISFALHQHTSFCLFRLAALIPLKL